MICRVWSMKKAVCTTLCAGCPERLRFGSHGLPLMGTGDWNDGMNKVGEKGAGESIWLGFFIYDVLVKFAGIASRQGDGPFADLCRQEAVRLKENIERSGWDGSWYRRAYCDDGCMLGSCSNTECRIDSIAQSWSVLSGAGDRKGHGRPCAKLTEPS
jgi:cellobiose phosphorylase